MKKKIEKVELILENCEVISIPNEHIVELVLDKIDRSIVKNENEYFEEYLTVKEFGIQIDKKANLKSNVSADFQKYTEEPFTRLQNLNDITGVEISYSDNSTELFSIKWYGDSEYNNRAQKSKIKNNGNLYILCANKISISDYFYSSTLN